MTWLYFFAAILIAYVIGGVTGYGVRQPAWDRSVDSWRKQQERRRR